MSDKDKKPEEEAKSEEPQASESAPQDADIDKSDETRHASEEAREEARRKMEEARAELNEQAEKSKTKHANLPETKNKKLEEELTTTKEHELESVRVYSPFKIYFDGPAKSISAINKTGPFDILPGHKNFMTLIVPCEVIIRTDQGLDKLKIERGVMHVRRNRVNLFLDV